MSKNYLIIIGTIIAVVVVGVLYFGSLHLSKTRELRDEDKELKNLLSKKEAENAIKNVDLLIEKNMGKGSTIQSDTERVNKPSVDLMPREMQELISPTIMDEEMENVEAHTNLELEAIGGSSSSSTQNVVQQAQKELFSTLLSGDFNMDAEGSDKFHNASGKVSIVNFKGENRLVFSDNFEVTRGPDYKIYLVNERGIETKSAFQKIKSNSKRIGEIKQFSGYQVFDIPRDIDIDSIKGVVIWCESFSQYISTADF